MRFRTRGTIVLGLLLSAVAWGQDAFSETREKTPLLWPASLEQYHKRFEQFDKQDAENMPAPGCAVFAGSSSITGWTLIPEDFKDINAINRGFGGAIIPQWLLMVDRYIIRYKPAKVVFYCGENDIARKHAPEKVRDDLEEFMDRIHTALPETEVYFISLKPSPSRWELWPTMTEANKLCKELCDRLPHATYVDVSEGMFGENDEPRKDIFRDDNLHMNRTGYTEIWIPQIRKALAGECPAGDVVAPVNERAEPARLNLVPATTGPAHAGGSPRAAYVAGSPLVGFASFKKEMPLMKLARWNHWLRCATAALVAGLAEMGNPGALACAGEPVVRVEVAEESPVVTFLSWDTEGGDRAQRNLLRSGQGVSVFVRVGGQWLSTATLPVRIVRPDPATTQLFLTVGDGTDLAWDLHAAADSLTMTFRAAGARPEVVEAIEIRFPFDPGVTPTTVLPARWDDDGPWHLPAVVSAPDFGQMLMTTEPSQPATGRLEGSRAEKTVDLIVTLPISSERAGRTLRLSPARLPAPAGLVDAAMWEQARRGWWGIWQPSARWGDQNRPFSAPAGILANNVISDPASCSLWFYADQAFWTPEVTPGITLAPLVRRAVDFWLLQRTRPDGEVVCYWDYGNFLDANAGPLIAAWDYVEMTGDVEWLNGRIERLEMIAAFLAKRDVDGDGMVEAVQSGNAGTLRQPARSCAWFDALNCGHKDGYTNALIYRAWRCLADLERKLGRAEKAAEYGQLADRLKASYFPALFNPATGWLAWWKSADGELHDYATPIVNGMAIEYGLVEPAQGREILDRLWTKMDAVGFERFDLGVPPMLIPVRRADYLLPDGLGIPQREDGTDTFGHYQNGGITAGQVLHFLAAHYVVDRPERADKVLRAMLTRQARGEFQNGVRDAAYQGIDWTDWQGRPTGYEGYLADSFRFLQAVLLREASFRARFYRPLHPDRDLSPATQPSESPAEGPQRDSQDPAAEWLTYVEEMQTVPALATEMLCKPWNADMQTRYSQDLAAAEAAWVVMARQVDARLTSERVKSLSRWAKTQMEPYRLPEKAAERARLVPLGVDARDERLVFEATLDTLPSHHALVTRWLKAFAVYERRQRAFAHVTITIRGERLE